MPCNDCHQDEGPAWAFEKVVSWYGPSQRPPHWGEILHAARRRTAGSPEALADLVADREVPAIVRGTAASLLSGSTVEAASDLTAASARSRPPWCGWEP